MDLCKQGDYNGICEAKHDGCGGVCRNHHPRQPVNQGLLSGKAEKLLCMN